MADSRENRPMRIAGCSGAASDRRLAMATFAANHPHDPIDVITGDWMSEANMTARAAQKHRSESLDAYEPSFLAALKPALGNICRYKIRVAVNAGASDTAKLAKIVQDLARSQNLDINVAHITGDQVLPAVLEGLKTNMSTFENICTGQQLRDWGFTPIAAQAYLGGLGIAGAFSSGAQIVLCGRVSDASPVIGAAFWWHNWRREQFHELANAFVAGHLIECSSYVCGGLYSGFKDLEHKGWHDIGYPIAEISQTGQVVITKQRGSGGEVSVHTCTAQLLYEIQGPWYYNSDVTAILDKIWFEQLGCDRVGLNGVQAAPPPPTTKVGITAPGGYQAEVHWFLTGLDIEAKARMMEAQVRHELAPHIPRFTRLEFSLIGTAGEDARNQNAATVDLRILAQAARPDDLNAGKFLRPCTDLIMEGYPGATCHLDFRMGFPRPIQEYFVTLLPQAAVQHMVHLWNGTSFEIPPPLETRVYPSKQPSQDEACDVKSRDWGPTMRGPLGWIVHGRSGDKGSDANVGFWVRHTDEWDWIRSLLSVATLKELLADEYKVGKRIDRCEFPNLHAVHFLLHDHLDRGVSCTTTYDFLGKNVVEYLRSKHVDLPLKFLNRGKL